MFDVGGKSNTPTPNPPLGESRGSNNVSSCSGDGPGNRTLLNSCACFPLLSSGIRFVYCLTSPWLVLLAFLILAVSCFCVSSGKSFLKSLKNVEFHDREDLIYERIAGELSCRCFCSEMLNVPPRGGEFLHG